MDLEKILKMIDEIEIDVTKKHIPDVIESFTETTTYWDFDIKSIKYRMHVVDRKHKEKQIDRIYFINLTQLHSVIRENYISDREYEDAQCKAKMGITGTGNPFRVFGSVYNQILEYVGENKPDYITFDAYEHNRNSLYARLSDRFLKDLFKHKNLKYKEINIDPTTNLTKKSTSFWFEKE